MKHFFIINPVAAKVKGKVNIITDSIHAFFEENKHLRHQLYITKWERDALGVIRREAMETDEITRVHVMGGSGTLFEAVNGVINLPNMQLAAYPFGRENSFLQYFGRSQIHLFSSIRSQVFSEIIPIDAFRCDDNYGIAYGLIGMEAVANKNSAKRLKKNNLLSSGFLFKLEMAKLAFFERNLENEYEIEVDGHVLDGYYGSMLIANGPNCGKNMKPAIHAKPNDGIFDFYFMKSISRLKHFFHSRKYYAGEFEKVSNIVTHISGKKFTVSSNEPTCMSIDGEVLYEKTAVFEILPYAIDLVCPNGVTMNNEQGTINNE